MIGRVPMWYWDLKARRYGARMKQRTLRAPREWAPPTVKQFPIVVHGSAVSTAPVLQGKRARRQEAARARILNSADPKNFPGNLEMPEYLYWGGAESSGGTYARCRVCFKGTYGKQDRTNHLRRERDSVNDLSCASKAQIIAKLLAKQEVCVMCDKKTHNTRWGLPICSSVVCLKGFMFGSITATGWRDAATQAARMGWAK